MAAEDLAVAVFPDQLACPASQLHDRYIRYHPLVNQTIADCLLEAMDFPGLKRVLEGMDAGAFTLIARDTTEPSPMCHEVLNARPYAFLDDAPLEERRTQAVITRRGLDVKTADEFGKLDQSAIDLVREQSWPDPETGDELHDALLIMGAVPSVEAGTTASWKDKYDSLVAAGRVTTVDGRLWVATERLPMVQAAFHGATHEPAVIPPERDQAKAWTREDAIRDRKSVVEGKSVDIGGCGTSRNKQR